MTVPATEPPLDQPYEGAPWGAAFRRFWKKGFTFSGRASRAEFWRSWVLTAGVLMVVYVVAGILRLLPGAQDGGFLLIPVALLYALVAVIPSIAVTVRRLHDTNQSGAAFFVSLIPFVGGLILLVMLAQPARREGARFDLPSSASVPPVTPASASSYGEIAVSTAGFPSTSSSPSLPPVPPPPSTRIPPAAVPPVPVASTPAAPAPPLTAPPVVAPQPFPPAAPPVDAPSSAAPAAAPAAAASALGGVSAAPAPISGIPGVESSFAQAAGTVDGDLGSTRIVPPRNAGGWILELPDGRRLGLEGAVSLGRDPVSESGGILVPIDDPARSMSKTHARFDLTETGVTVTDLHSTNGTRIDVPGLPAVSVASGVATTVPVGGTVVLGEYVVRVQRR